MEFICTLGLTETSYVSGYGPAGYAIFVAVYAGLEVRIQFFFLILYIVA